jgi:hypothetical protein
MSLAAWWGRACGSDRANDAGCECLAVICPSFTGEMRLCMYMFCTALEVSCLQHARFCCLFVPGRCMLRAPLVLGAHQHAPPRVCCHAYNVCRIRVSLLVPLSHTTNVLHGATPTRFQLPGRVSYSHTCASHTCSVVCSARTAVARLLHTSLSAVLLGVRHLWSFRPKHKGTSAAVQTPPPPVGALFLPVRRSAVCCVEVPSALVGWLVGCQSRLAVACIKVCHGQNSNTRRGDENVMSLTDGGRKVARST